MVRNERSVMRESKLAYQSTICSVFLPFHNLETFYLEWLVLCTSWGGWTDYTGLWHDGNHQSTWRNIYILGRNKSKRSIRGACRFYEMLGHMHACIVASWGLIKCSYLFSYVAAPHDGDDKTVRKCVMMGITEPTWRYTSKLWKKMSRSRQFSAEMASLWY